MTRKWVQPATAGLLFAGFLALYVSTRSISLDDFDSFNFARAIDRFDLRLNQPQPPGYPVYIFLARLLDLLVRNHQNALTLLSAVCGAAGVLAFFGLARDVGSGWAALPLAVTPLFWLSSGMALSDVPGLAFAIGAVWLVERGVRRLNARDARRVGDPSLYAQGDKRRGVLLALGCALAGIAAGVRPQDAVVPLGVILFWAIPKLWSWRLLAVGAGSFIGACLLWAVPLALTFPSLSQAWTVMVAQSLYVGSTDSLVARPLTVANVGARLAEFGSVFSGYSGGPRDAGLAAFLALAAAVLVLALACRRGRGLALAWLLPYAGLMVLAMRPDDPRKVLPVIPAMLLLLAGVSPRMLAVGASLALAIASSAVAAPLIKTLDTIAAPPEQAAAFLGVNFSPADTLVIAGQSYNAIRYRQPAFKAYLVDELDRAAVARDLGSGVYRNLVLLDKDGFAVPENYAGVDSRTFHRDALVLPKAATVWLAVYRPLADLPPSQLELPTGAVHIGTAEDAPYLMDGWYRPEDIGGTAARWSDQQASLRFWVDRAVAASLQLVGVAYPPGQQLTVLVNGQQAAQLSMSRDWAPYNISLQGALFHAGAINTVTLEHRAVASAYQATQGESLDRRPLAAAYSSFQVSWQ